MIQDRAEMIAAACGLGHVVRAAERLGIDVQVAAERTIDSVNWPDLSVIEGREERAYRIAKAVNAAAKALR